ncbi:cob(I)yrinic acid a,c-diamide adenosyltransferase [Chloroflexota bacterium]
MTEEFSCEESNTLNLGLVQVFSGDGKGKTSAALGTVLRALGCGLKVYIVFFMKGDYPYSEGNILSQLPNLTIARFGSREFVNPANVKPPEIEQAAQALAAAHEAVLSGKYDVVLLDEVNVAAGWELVKVDDVLKIIDDKPKNVELILTGRYADDRIIEKADLVTEMRKIKHPFDKGIMARKGIDY